MGISPVSVIACTASSRKPVEAVFVEPVKRVLDREGAHLRHAVVDRAAPGRLRFGEKGRRIAAEIISFRAEVVIDDVEKHHQPAQMRLVDQKLQVVRPAIGAVGCVPQHAVIAPVAQAAKSASGSNSSAVMPVSAR